MQQTSTKAVQENRKLVRGYGDPLGIVQEIRILPHKPESIQEIETHEIIWDFEI